MLFGPNGHPVQQARPEHHWPPEFMKMLSVFAETLGHTNLGLFCTQCKQPLAGHNAREDNYWHMECACRKYLGKNPLPTSQRRAN